MKKISFFVLSLLVMTMIMGCNGNKKNVYLPEAKNDAAYTVIGGADGPTDIVINSEGLTKYKSELGFEVKYDVDKFGHSFENNIEKFTYETKGQTEESILPTYITVVLNDEMDAKTVTDGLVLQSGKDDVIIGTSRFGADSIDTAIVQYTKENAGGEQIFSFHIFDTDKGTMIIEAVGYVGQDNTVDSKFEQFFANFSIK